MERTVESLEKTVVFDRVVTIPCLQARIDKFMVSNASLADDSAKCRLEIADLRKENAQLRERNSTCLLRLKQEEQCREGQREEPRQDWRTRLRLAR